MKLNKNKIRLKLRGPLGLVSLSEYTILSFPYDNMH